MNKAEKGLNTILEETEKNRENIGETDNWKRLNSQKGRNGGEMKKWRTRRETNERKDKNQGKSRKK